MSRVDLHIHSTISDGKFTPEAIVRKAVALDMIFIALADHDSVDGISTALKVAKSFPQLKVIPAVEISTDLTTGEAHILGYFIDYTSNTLKSTLERFRNSRLGRAQGMIAKLRGLGINVEWQRVQQIAGDGSVGRPHIAQAMLEKGYITSIKEAFVKYIGQGGPAYVEREKMTPAEAVKLIVQSRGLPVLAHPFTIIDPQAMVIDLKKAGLVGLESYYDSYNTDEIRELVNLASRHNLIATGGSDYHGLDDSTETMIGGVEVPISSAERLIELADRRTLRMANI